MKGQRRCQSQGSELTEGRRGRAHFSGQGMRVMSLEYVYFKLRCYSPTVHGWELFEKTEGEWNKLTPAWPL